MPAHTGNVTDSFLLHNTEPAIRILLVDDHTMVREVFGRVLSDEDGIEVVGTAGTVAEAKELILATSPDIILMDILFPDGSGIDLARFVKSDHLQTKVIFLTALRDEEAVLSCIEAGADGYVIKNSTYDSLIESIKHVMAGKQLYDPLIVSPILQQLIMSAPALAQVTAGKNNGALTAREREVARLISRGLTNKEIAQTLSISINTAKTHIQRLFRRLDISSRRDLLSGRHLPPEQLL